MAFSRAAAALLLVACLAGSANAQMPMITGSINMGHACYSNPAAASCATFKRSSADYTDDMNKLCAAMPFMIGCDLWRLCKAAKSTRPLCTLPSLVGDICLSDSMSKMKGCEAYNTLCKAGSKVQQCKGNGAVMPNVMTTFATKTAIDVLCQSGSKPASLCSKCSSLGSMNYAQCPSPLMALAGWCRASAANGKTTSCGAWRRMCATANVKATYPAIC